MFWMRRPALSAQWLDFVFIRARCRFSRHRPHLARRRYPPSALDGPPSGRGAARRFPECHALACRTAGPATSTRRTSSPARGLKIIDNEIVVWPPHTFRPSVVRRIVRSNSFASFASPSVSKAVTSGKPALSVSGAVAARYASRVQCAFGALSGVGRPSPRKCARHASRIGRDRLHSQWSDSMIIGAFNYEPDGFLVRDAFTAS